MSKQEDAGQMSIHRIRKTPEFAQRAEAVLNWGMSRNLTLRKLVKQKEKIDALRAILAKRDAGEDVGIRPENLVWVFGSGRTGSSWLTFMMGALPNHTRWNEPQIGYLFGHPYYERYWTRQDSEHFILGADYREAWLNSIRSLVLGGALTRFPERADKGYIVVKEPHGSIGAPLLMQALPESRMILLVRDPRDRAASILDAHRKGHRPSKRRTTKRQELFESNGNTKADERPDAFVKAQARAYLRDITSAKQAYEAHRGQKVMVRYEDLRAETFETMKRIYSSLHIPVDEGELGRAVEQHSWENIPEDERGPGNIRRKATPGGWREDLTPEQVEIVEQETAAILEQFYTEG